MKPEPFISIVSPVYRAETIVDELVKRICEEIVKITHHFEIILVEDGSPDSSWAKIRENCKANSKVKGIRLSRNFGQHHAITAGVFHAKGDYIIVMDCDLQDNPKYFYALYDKIREDFNIIYTVKKEREHTLIKNSFALIFHSLFNWLIGRNKGISSSGKIGTYSLITRKVADAYIAINDYHRPYLIILQWLGFSNSHIQVEHDQRFEGKSSYSFLKLASHAVNGIISQTDRLLILSIYVGFLFSFVGFIFIISILHTYFAKGLMVGWTSIVVLIIFNTGLLLMTMGVVGAYIGQIFVQTKNRPLFIIDQKENM